MESIILYRQRLSATGALGRQRAIAPLAETISEMNATPSADWAVAIVRHNVSSFNKKYRL